jgi:ABC-type uncharacterized transport system permease subunit
LPWITVSSMNGLEAARRAGLKVGLLLSAMLVGGALAGMAGMVHFAGTELQLQAGMTAAFGYIGFLASWLAGHHPFGWPARRCCSPASPWTGTACRSPPACPRPP